MEKKEKTYKTLRFAFYESRKHSFILTACFIIVFLIARILGIAELTEIRFVNYVIAFFVCYDAIKKVYIRNNNEVEYFTGLSIGIITVILGQLWYSILFFIYLKIDYVFANELLKQIPQNIISPVFSTAVLLFLEGFGLSPVISLALMQYFKSKQGRWAHTTGKGSF
jgi:hypothetical protein